MRVVLLNLAENESRLIAASVIDVKDLIRELQPAQNGAETLMRMCDDFLLVIARNDDRKFKISRHVGCTSPLFEKAVISLADDWEGRAAGISTEVHSNLGATGNVARPTGIEPVFLP